MPKNQTSQPQKRHLWVSREVRNRQNPNHRQPEEGSEEEPYRAPYAVKPSAKTAPVRGAIVACLLPSFFRIVSFERCLLRIVSPARRLLSPAFVFVFDLSSLFFTMVMHARGRGVAARVGV